MLPAVELQFDYISREKRRKRYVLLDEDPQEALQVKHTVLKARILFTDLLISPSLCLNSPVFA